MQPCHRFPDPILQNETQPLAADNSATIQCAAELLLPVGLLAALLPLLTAVTSAQLVLRARNSPSQPVSPIAVMLPKACRLLHALHFIFVLLPTTTPDPNPAAPLQLAHAACACALTVWACPVLLVRS